MKQVFIASAVRTPVASFQGSFADMAATRLGAIAIREALKVANVEATQVDEVIMGEVLTAGVGQAPARQAAIYAGVPVSTPCLTVGKVCGSGLKAVMLAVNSISAGDNEIVVAGGQESMSQAPHLLQNSRTGFRMGNTLLVDSMQHDGLWDPYNDWAMGVAGELCAKEYGFTREAQDAFAIGSYTKAQNAQASGHFKNEIVPVTVKTRKGEITVSHDEDPSKTDFAKIPSLKPVFDKQGTITAANASKINDGAAALVLMSEAAISNAKIKPLAKIVAMSQFAQDPKWFTTAPVGAIRKVLAKANLTLEQIDLFEINEAFANVPMAAMKDLGIPAEKVNVHGGAIAIGHPIGASGARVLTTLVHAMQSHQKKFGLATLCIGGGEAVAMIVERVR